MDPDADVRVHYAINYLDNGQWMLQSNIVNAGRAVDPGRAIRILDILCEYIAEGAHPDCDNCRNWLQLYCNIRYLCEQAVQHNILGIKPGAQNFVAKRKFN